ncbi:MAG: two pore domain potassium channel family protein [Thermoleophilia bacterium]|nr:two pore domain potassium channel family protein [Thermoleophilia bacterium]
MPRHTRIRVGRYLRQHVASTRTIAAVGVATLLLVVFGGIAVTHADHDRFTSLFDGWWWAATTITTVGYGDIVPTSTAGRIIGLVLMFAGIALVSLLTASIAALLLSGDVEQEEQHLERRLDSIEQTLAEIQATLVVRDPAQPDEL